MITDKEYQYLIDYVNITPEIKKTLDSLWISKRKIKAYSEYKDLSKNYKETKNNEYWIHYDNLDNFYEYAKSLNKDLGEKELYDTCLISVAQRSIWVKLSDRIHNLRTMRELHKDHIIRNLEDTKKLINIATELYNKKELQNGDQEVLKRKIKLLCKEAKWLSEFINDSELIEYFEENCRAWGDDD